MIFGRKHSWLLFDVIHPAKLGSVPRIRDGTMHRIYSMPIAVGFNHGVYTHSRLVSQIFQFLLTTDHLVGWFSARFVRSGVVQDLCLSFLLIDTEK